MQDGNTSLQPADVEKHANQSTTAPVTTNETPTDEPFSIYTKKQKRLMVVFAAIAAFFSPLTASIYLPALNTLAKDLNVSNSQITLTITTYLVCKAHLAP
jgi:hypothetical protein